MRIVVATTGEMREPDAGSSGNNRIVRSAGPGERVAAGKASDMCNVAGHVSERTFVAELLRLIEQPADLRHASEHQFLQLRMKSHRRGRFRVALEPLRKRFKPNPFVNPPPIDVEVSGDIRHHPSLAKQFMHAGK